MLSLPSPQFIYLPPPTLQSHSLSSLPTLPSSLSFSLSVTTPKLNQINQHKKKKKLARIINMLLGKRPRPPIRRTTSMTGMAVDLSNMDDHDQEVVTENSNSIVMMDVHAEGPAGSNYAQNPNIINNYGSSLGYHEQHRFLAMLSPRNNSSNHRRNSASDIVETAPFLRTCGLCKRRLASGRDLYMYRGDTAFCSLECREEQMKQDEKLEKCKDVASKKEDRHATRSASSKASGKPQTVAAA